MTCEGSPSVLCIMYHMNVWLAACFHMQLSPLGVRCHTVPSEPTASATKTVIISVYGPKIVSFVSSSLVTSTVAGSTKVCPVKTAREISEVELLCSANKLHFTLF
jgi:hypothetical protein